MSLLESVVYCACTVLLVGLIGQAGLLYVKTCREALKRSETWVQVALALDHFYDDISYASSEPSAWKVATTTKVIFRYKGKDCGWYRYKGNLVRVLGYYDEKKNRWSEKATSLILTSLASLSFTFIQENEHMKGVLLRLTKKVGVKSVALECFNALTNSVL